MNLLDDRIDRYEGIGQQFKIAHLRPMTITSEALNSTEMRVNIE